MSESYTGRWARRYNRLWGRYTERTLASALEMIDFAALERASEVFGRPPRALDVACGTGILLRSLLERVPDLEAYGVDASAEMLAQARTALSAWPQVQLVQAALGPGETVKLPHPPEGFDLITCTNALHYFSEPVKVLAGLRHFLAPNGQIVLEDYARREPPFPWSAFEWLVRRVDSGHARAYTLAEACTFCVQAGFQVVDGKIFPVDWLWHAWALSAYGVSTT